LDVGDKAVALGFTRTYTLNGTISLLELRHERHCGFPSGVPLYLDLAFVQTPCSCYPKLLLLHFLEMKLLSYGCLISLVTSATSGVVSGQELHEDFTAINSSSKVSIAAADPQLAVDTPPPPDHDSIWHKAYCRGAALVRAMSLDEEESNTMLQWPYTQSPWDGDLKPELRKWGWLDNEEDNTNIDDSCDFDEKLKMKNTFDALGVDTRPAGKGGPNHCFRLQHSNGPTVIRDKNGKMPYLSSQRYEADGKTYRVSNLHLHQRDVHQANV